MIKTTRKSFIAIILVLAMTICYMPIVTPAVEATDEVITRVDIPGISESGSGSETDTVTNEPTDGEAVENDSDAGESGSGSETGTVTNEPTDGGTEKSVSDTDEPDSATEIHTEIKSFPTAPLSVGAEGIIPSTSLPGLGTPGAPFEIASAADLAYMRDQVNINGAITPRGGGGAVTARTAHYKLTADIALGYWKDDGDGIVEDGEIYDSESGGTAYSASNWTPIGNTSMFKGTFDGDDHTVSGIYINETLGFQGLFDYADGATIKNIGVTDSYICGKSAAGIVGYIKNSTKLTNCYNTGSIIGVAYVAGVVGQSYNNNTFFGCYNTGSVKGSQEVVGIPGIGGVVGYNSSNSTISGCYNTGKKGTKYPSTTTK